jgi:hypothetical protein
LKGGGKTFFIYTTGIIDTGSITKTIENEMYYINCWIKKIKYALISKLRTYNFSNFVINHYDPFDYLLGIESYQDEKLYDEIYKVNVRRRFIENVKSLLNNNQEQNITEIFHQENFPLRLREPINKQNHIIIDFAHLFEHKGDKVKIEEGHGYRYEDTPEIYRKLYDYNVIYLGYHMPCDDTINDTINNLFDIDENREIRIML